jgi:hypothetical protein
MSQSLWSRDLGQRRGGSGPLLGSPRDSGTIKHSDHGLGMPSRAGRSRIIASDQLHRQLPGRQFCEQGWKLACRFEFPQFTTIAFFRGT